jgi:hypothetical protein
MAVANFWGARMGDVAEIQQSGRMTAAEEEDTALATDRSG